MRIEKRKANICTWKYADVKNGSLVRHNGKLCMVCGNDKTRDEGYLAVLETGRLKLIPDKSIKVDVISNGVTIETAFDLETYCYGGDHNGLEVFSLKNLMPGTCFMDKHWCIYLKLDYGDKDKAVYRSLENRGFCMDSNTLCVVGLYLLTGEIEVMAVNDTGNVLRLDSKLLVSEI